MKITNDRVRKVLAGVLIVSGMYFMIFPQIRNYIIQVNIEQLLTTTEEELRENKQKEGMIDFEGVKEVSKFSGIATTINKSEGYVIGRIQIETVGLDLPIINSLTNRSLYFGAGIMKHEQVMGEGNYSLASHHMKNPDLLFSPLDRVKIGDKIIISDDTGEYMYEVTETAVIASTAVEVIENIEKERLITLITCADSGENRLMVRGELVN